MFVFQIENFLGLFFFLTPYVHSVPRHRAKLAMHKQTSEGVRSQLLMLGWFRVGCGLATRRFLGKAGGRALVVGQCGSGATHRPPHIDPAPQPPRAWPCG